MNAQEPQEYKGGVLIACKDHVGVLSGPYVYWYRQLKLLWKGIICVFRGHQVVVRRYKTNKDHVTDIPRVVFDAVECDRCVTRFGVVYLKGAKRPQPYSSLVRYSS